MDFLLARRGIRRGPTVSGAIGEVQKRRDGFPDEVPSNSVGSIVAHEAIVIEPSRAFFRAVEPEAKRNNASRAPQWFATWAHSPFAHFARYTATSGSFKKRYLLLA